MLKCILSMVKQILSYKIIYCYNSIYILQIGGIKMSSRNNNGGGLGFWQMVGAVILALIIFSEIG